MIRMPINGGWRLTSHPEHGRLAGAFAKHWGNTDFPVHEPKKSVNHAVSHHDDAWQIRDKAPFLTKEGLPSAFSKELVGTYDSFEEIDMEDYLGVRGQAAALVAKADPYAAVIISMHTHNLLTEHVDPATLTAEQSVVLKKFNEAQTAQREAWIESLKEDAVVGPYTGFEQRNHAFEFLQACDSLSLTACVDFPEPIALQHKHAMSSGELVEILCTPLGNHTYRLSPYPLDMDEILFELYYRFVSQESYDSLDVFREEYAAAPVETLIIKIVR